MLTLLKWLAGLFITLVVLLLAAIVIVPMVFDPNDYRDEITKLVKEQTGRDLTLSGKLTVSVFPWLGIRTEGLSLSQPEQIGGDMVSVDTAQLRIKFTPLISKQVHVDTVVLEEPTLRLVTLKNGTDSFAGLSSDDTSVEPEDSSSNAGAAVALVIQGLELTNGSLVIEDRAAGTTTEISQLNMVTGNLIGESLADIDVSGVLKSSDSPDSLDFSLSSKARIDTDTLAVRAENLLAQVTQGELAAEVGFASLTVVEQAKIALTDLSVNVTAPQAVSLSAATVSANLDTQRAELPLLSIQAGELQASLTNLVATQFIDAPNASGKLEVPAFNAAKLLKDFDIDYQTTDPKVLQNVALSASFSGSLDGAAVKQLLFTLDDSKLSGSASVRNFEAPSADFNLSLDTLNLDRYLPPTEEGAEQEDAVSGGEALAVPLAAFKEINANGQFKAKQLVSGGLEMNNIDVQVRSTPGSVTITPSAALYDGKLGGTVAYSESGDEATLSVKNEIDLVELGKMLNAAEVTDQLSGIGSLAVDLLVTEVNGVQSNQGVITLSAKDGAVQGVDIKGMIDGAYTKYQQFKGVEPKQAETGKSNASDETRFAELFGTFKLNNNVVTNDDFTMKAPLFRVGGKGTIDIEKQALDYLVEIAVVASTDGQGGEALEKLKGVTIPVRFSGDLTAPNYSIDVKRMFKALFQKDLDRKKAELLEEKYGIEDGEELSSKDVLKQLLINKLDEKEKKRNGQERPLNDSSAPADKQGAAEPAPNSEAAADAPAATPEQSQPEQEQKSAKDQLKDDLKNKLLDGLFN